MITKINKEQEKQIPKTIEKWIGMASKPMDHKKAIEYTGKLYQSMGLEKPLVIFGFSPMNTILLCELFFRLVKEDKNLFKKLDSQLDSQISSQLYSQLRSQLYSQISSQLRSQLDSQISSQLDSQISSQLDSQISSQLDSQISSQIDSQISSQLDSQISSQIDSQLYSQISSQISSQLDSQPNNEVLKSINSNWYLGIYWLVWCGWYEYGKSIGVEFDNDKYDLFVNFNSEVNFIIPYKNICFISEKPIQIHWNNGMLHKDGGMAVQYSDGYGMHFLNGVKVPEYLAMTSESDLDIEFFKKEVNADVKAEFIRKFGIQRMESMGEEMDSFEKYNEPLYISSQYKLINMGRIFNKDNAPFLKMKNQTVEGVFHIEGVSPDCKSIPEALKFRAKNRSTKVEAIK